MSVASMGESGSGHGGLARSFELGGLERGGIALRRQFAGDFVERAAGEDGAVVLVNVPGGINGVVLMLDHQPLGLLFAALVRTRTKLPRSFSPASRNLISPCATCSLAPWRPSTRNVPRSQTITEPAP